MMDLFCRRDDAIEIDGHPAIGVKEWSFEGQPDASCRFGAEYARRTNAAYSAIRVAGTFLWPGDPRGLATARFEFAQEGFKPVEARMMKVDDHGDGSYTVHLEVDDPRAAT